MRHSGDATIVKGIHRCLSSTSEQRIGADAQRRQESFEI